MSVVYGAVELGTGREVALKLLTLAKRYPELALTVQRRAVELGSLWSHPNVVTLLRAMEAADGLPVLVFERAVRALGPEPGHKTMTVDQVVAAGIKIAGALEAAHRLGVIHGDVRPKNLFLTAFGEPSLSDFGMARVRAAAQSSVASLDVHTSHVPPELLEGKEGSEASDIYSLASTLYELLTGRGPFRPGNGASPAASILRILRDAPPALPDWVPMDLAQLIMHALAKRPEERLSSSLEFVQLLGRVEQDHGSLPTALLVGNAGTSSASVEHLPSVPSVSPGLRTDATIVGDVLEDETTEEPPYEEPIAGYPDATSDIPNDEPAERSLCPNGHTMSTEAQFCATCGARRGHAGTTASAAQTVRRCPNNHVVTGDAVFCRTCGLPIPARPAVVVGSDTAAAPSSASLANLSPPSCPNGHPIQIGARPQAFCRICGVPMMTP